jgi:hypothetical protein
MTFFSKRGKNKTKIFLFLSETLNKFFFTFPSFFFGNSRYFLLGKRSKKKNMALTATNTSSSSSLLLRPRPRRRSDFKKLPSRARASCFSSRSSAFSLTSIDDRERRKTILALRRKRRDVRANVVSLFLRNDDVALFSLLAASLVGVLRKGEKKKSSSSSSSSSAVLFASLVFLPARVARWCCGKQGIQ